MSECRLLPTQSRTSSHLNEYEKVSNSWGAVRNYKVDIESDSVNRRGPGKERTPSEETNVTIYEQGHGYTF